MIMLLYRYWKFEKKINKPTLDVWTIKLKFLEVSLQINFSTANLIVDFRFVLINFCTLSLCRSIVLHKLSMFLSFFELCYWKIELNGGGHVMSTSHLINQALFNVWRLFDDLNGVVVGYAHCYSKGPGFEFRIRWSFSEGFVLDCQSSLVNNKPFLEWHIYEVEKVIDLLHIHG
jgi:hypothetical protein